MADKFSLNYALASNSNYFSGIWRLTRVMKAAGWSVVAHSDGTTKQASGTNNNDSWGSNSDPLLDTYPSFNSAAAWIVMQGPSTVKLSFTTAPTGTFVRGEQVSQATSSATGELIGVVWDSTVGAGWAIIMPRTGTFNNSNVVTGSISSATFTPNSYKNYRREIVISKASGNTTDGSIFYVCAESTAESASLFSTLASASGCTATVAPGQGGTSNSFPTIAICIRGTAGSVSHDTFWNNTSSIPVTGIGHFVATNVIPSGGTSADGTFWGLCNKSSPTNSMAMFGFFRLDDSEPGDVDPYAWYCSSGTNFSSYSRTSSTNYATSSHDDFNQIFNTNYIGWKGYASRDGYYSARDVSLPLWASYLNTTTGWSPSVLRNGAVFAVQNHPTTGSIVPREPVYLVSDAQVNNIRMYKGRPRWVNVVSIGSAKDTFDGKKWIVLGTYSYSSNSNGSPGVIIGPWDATTSPQ